MAINAQILSEMEIPEDYIESLPKVKTEEREEEYLNRDASLLSPLTFFSFFYVEMLFNDFGDRVAQLLHV